MKSKRIVSLSLAVALVLGVGGNALANEENPTETSSDVAVADNFTDIDDNVDAEDSVDADDAEMPYRGTFLGACSEVQLLGFLGGDVPGWLIGIVGAPYLCNMGCKYLLDAKKGKCEASDTYKVGSVCVCYY